MEKEETKFGMSGHTLGSHSSTLPDRAQVRASQARHKIETKVCTSLLWTPHFAQTLAVAARTTDGAFDDRLASLPVVVVQELAVSGMEQCSFHCTHLSPGWAAVLFTLTSLHLPPLEGAKVPHPGQGSPS